MKVVILAGGLGTRLESLTENMPKPMAPIGDMPILWHIMNLYAYYGFNEFVVALGYKGDVIRDFFYHYQMVTRDFTMDLATHDAEFHGDEVHRDWKVTLAETGRDTLKGGRIKRIEKYLDSDLTMLTYGDGLADIDLAKLLEFHKSHNKTITVTGVYPPSRFGEILEEDGRASSFAEKPQTSSGLINGGFMVFDRRLLDHLDEAEDCDFERGALETLAQMDEVMVYHHKGSWLCMDTKRDFEYLNRLWETDTAFWKVWD